MSTRVETAKDLLTFAGGPSLLGTAALLAYLGKVLASSDRKPQKAWTALGAGVLLVAWLAVFVVWAAPTVTSTWTADGPADVTLVLLSATWFIAIALVALLLYRSPDLGRCLTESYRAGEGPWLVRWLRRNLKSSD